jgi:aspartokinase-like uncharacterized kinase
MPSTSSHFEARPFKRSLSVFKIGGSLFELPMLASVLRGVFALRADHDILIVAGGGRCSNIVRAWDARHRLGDSAAHWLAIDAMMPGARLLGHLLPEAREAADLSELAACRSEQRPAILNARAFLNRAESAGQPPLPHSWSVTSDSIAAWTARVAGAAELVLVKSTPLPAAGSLAAAAAENLVDPFFPLAACGIPRLGWVNARAHEPVIEDWPRKDRHHSPA